MLMRKVMLDITSIFLLVLFCCFGFNVQAEVINKNQKENSKVKVQNKVESKSQKEQPKVSVIIPVYNTEQYLRQCMDSIVNQTLKDIEIICVNDGSTDSSLNILKEYESKDPRVIVIDKEHKNAGAARNAGLKIAKGDYLVFVDSDDYAEPDYLKLMYEKIVADDADVCVCKASRKNIKKNKLYSSKDLLDSSLVPNKVFCYKDIPENFFQFTGSEAWNKIFKRELVIKNNLYFQEIISSNDYFFTYACLVKANRITIVNKLLYFNIRGHENNLQSTVVLDPRSSYCFFDANLKLHSYLVNQGIYNDLEISFIKKFIRCAFVHNSRFKQNKNEYIKIFNIIKKELEKYKIKENFNNLDSELKQKAEFFLSSTAEQAYEKVAPKRREIPIAMAMDNNYVLPTIVSMTSMLENANKNSFYKYYLLVSEDFTEENKNKFLSLQKKYSNNCSIQFIKMSNEFDNNRTAKHITSATYFRLRLPSLLSDESKCLYIDGDTIVLNDLCKLYNTNINDYYIAGVKAASYHQVGQKYAEKLNIPDIKKYVNAGVLLINLDKMRKENIESKFDAFIPNLKKIKSNGADQDTINAVCYDKIKILPFKYNAMTDYKFDGKEIWEKSKKFQNCFTKSEWYEAKKNPVIIHYAGKIKPWNDKKSCMSEHWWKYASKTKEFNEIKSKFWYNYFSKLPKEQYPEALKEWYKEKMGSDLDLDHPQTYTEKMQWLKLNDMDELKTKLTDKFLVRDWVKEKIGEKYLTKLLGVWDKFDDIDFDKLPNKFVLKANHGCGWNIIITDKSKFNKEDAKRKFDKWLNTNYAFKVGLELQYKNIKPKIIAEEYLENENNDLYDYKVWCFDGKPYYIMFLSERKKSLKMAFYDNKWNLQPFYYTYKWNNIPIKKPDNLNEILDISKKLSEGFKHARVDLYRLNNGTLKFGEITFSSASGNMKWHPEKYNKVFGDLIKLPTDKNRQKAA